MLNFKSVNITASVIFIGLLLLNVWYPISFGWFAVIFLIWLLLTTLGSGLVRWNYHFKLYNANPKITQPFISITFDDGPHPKYTPRVLALLKKHHAKATFFCIGKHIKKHPELFKNIIDDGHTVGNHTYSHSNAFGFFKTETVIAELNKTNELVNEVSTLEMMLFRPAFGVTNPRIKKALKSTQLIPIGWSKRSLDTTTLSANTILKRITKNLKKGDVILLHDTSDKSVMVLEQLLLFLQQQKLQSVTVDTLFNIKPYA